MFHSNLALEITNLFFQRLFDTFQLELLYTTDTTSGAELTFPEKNREAQLYINDAEFITVSTTGGEIERIKPIAKLDSDAACLLLPHFDHNSAIGSVFLPDLFPSWLFPIQISVKFIVIKGHLY